MYYFDCAASAPILPCAMEAFIAAPQGNPDSLHSAGREARAALEQARADIAACINADPSEIIFTSGATEANNIALTILMHNCIDVRVSPFEHQSMACTYDEPNGLRYMYGVSQMLANNETGRVYTLPEREDDMLLLCDATSAVGHIPIDVKALNVDYLTAGGHKFGAPKGIGFLYIRDGAPTFSIMKGGSQENGIRPGTPPVNLACAMAAALKYKTEKLNDGISLKLTVERRDYLIRRLMELGGVINAKWDDGEKWCLPNILSVRFPGVKAQRLLVLLDAMGFCCSAGSACHSGDDEPSAVLLAHKLTPKEAKQTIRISFTEETPIEDMVALADAIQAAIEKMKAL